MRALPCVKWRESTSCWDTKRGSEPRHGWQPVIRILRQIERTRRGSLYANSLVCDTLASSRESVIEKKTPVIANVMARPCRICSSCHKYLLLQEDSNYAYHSRSYGHARRKQLKIDFLGLLFYQYWISLNSNDKCRCKIKSMNTDS